MAKKTNLQKNWLSAKCTLEDKATAETVIH
jgi:hypothetical protein